MKKSGKRGSSSSKDKADEDVGAMENSQSTNIFFRSPKVVLIVGFLALFITTLLIYIPSLNNGYIWDDPEYILNNQTLRSVDGLKDIWLKPGATPQYYPLVFTTFWVEYHFWKLEAFGYHFVNHLLHALCAALLWLILRKLKTPGSFIIAVLFASHPVYVESVAWITERKNVLSTLFYLLAALSYLRFALPSDLAKKSNGWIFYTLALILFTLALFSKTVTCTLPAALILILWWKKTRIKIKDILPLIPFFVVGIALGYVTICMERDHVGAQGDEWSLTMLEKCLLAGRIPWFYAMKLIYPDDLTFIYPRWEINVSVWWQYIFPLASLGAIFLLYIKRATIGKGPVTAVCFFVGSLFPALGFFNVFPMRFSFVADHFQYLASIGFIALVVSVVYAIFKKLELEKGPIPVVTTVPIILVLCIITCKQQKIYRNQEMLWGDTLKKNYSAWIAHSNLGEILVSKGEMYEKSGWDDQATMHFNSAIMHCSFALQLKKDLPEAHGNMANALYHKKSFDEAINHYQKLLSFDPDNLLAKTNMAATYQALGNNEDAHRYFNEVLKANSDFINAHYNLAQLLLSEDRGAEAAEHFAEVVRLKPEAYDAHFYLGSIYSKKLDNRGVNHLKTALTGFKAQGNTNRVTQILNMMDNYNR